MGVGSLVSVRSGSSPSIGTEAGDAVAVNTSGAWGDGVGVGVGTKTSGTGVGVYVGFGGRTTVGVGDAVSGAVTVWVGAGVASSQATTVIASTRHDMPAMIRDVMISLRDRCGFRFIVMK